VVNLDAASSSQIVTKDLHEGPPLTPEELPKMLDWLFAERDAASHNPDMPIQQLDTPPMAVQLCTTGDTATCPINHIALDGIPTDGTKLTGAEISFVAQQVGSSLYLSRMAGNGGTSGSTSSTCCSSRCPRWPPRSPIRSTATSRSSSTSVRTRAARSAAAPRTSSASSRPT